MAIRLLILILGFLLMPDLAYCQNSGEKLFGGIVMLVIISPYYVFSLIPYFIQKKNKGKSIFLSLFTYILCFGGIALANYQTYRFQLPALRFDGLYGLFYLIILPFLIIIILAAIKDYRHRSPIEDEL